MAARTNFGDETKRLMAQAGLNAAEMARRCGVTYQSVQSLVAKGNPSMAVAVRYLSELGYDVVIAPRGKRLPEGSAVIVVEREGGDRS